jgi:predicted nucleotidyltransferase
LDVFKSFPEFKPDFTKHMENQLHARDRVGVQDFVLLEDFKSQEAFLENLRKRYQADLIYVSIYRNN